MEKLELSGSVESIIYHNEKNSYTVFVINTGDELICATGIIPVIAVGESIKVKGVYKIHQTYGEQFSVESYEKEVPATIPAIYNYLASGNIKGVGEATAKRIVDQFGEQTIQIIENHPEQLIQIRGISREKAFKISEQIINAFGFEDLCTFLMSYGITAEEAVKIWAVYGTESKNIIKENPYVVCNENIGIDFQKAEDMSQKSENSIDISYRIKAALNHILMHNASNGFTCIPREQLVPTCVDFIEIDEGTIEMVLNECIKEATLYSYIRPEDEIEFIFLPIYYQAETYVASRIKMLLEHPPEPIPNVYDKIAEIEKYERIEYADLQKQAIAQALTKGMLILTGGPGTGKTTTLNAIIKILKDNKEVVFLAAPTGRAAQRLSDVTGCEAKTIHRLLEVGWSEHDRPVFKKNEDNLLKCTTLIIDETSMIDALLMESVMRAFPLNCRLIFVGDVDQLPSVGAGNVLRDIINSGKVPTIALNKVFRQSMESLIITNAHLINQGKNPIIDRVDKDFFFLKCRNADEMKNTVVSLCSTRLPRAYGYSVMSEIQVLAPSKIKSAGTYELNKALQAEINPPDDTKIELVIDKKILRLGDKVMQQKNNYNINWVRNDGTVGTGVFNGEIGVLSSINRAGRKVTVTFDDKIATYTYDDVVQLDLAYCVTVHKSQGNEFEVVIIPLWQTPKPLLYRNLFYTAVTRAKKLLIIVGDSSEIEAMVENEKKNLRYTMLAEFLENEQ